ncbi:MarR family winged helix-turn-helix transcriptional regulator [Streptomyces sp. NPDC058291]|jgi:DNA-binding MarR family transcriptional regulator|uniref:MarR family winged helix-turn-helix transcriptional regulator n=1 Tax=Streptomyces sp. NPDC058291 TaxID=3346427 RepID=UPI0036E50FEE
MTTTAPTVDGRVVALAHYASRALVENVLTAHGATFHQSVVIRAVALAAGSTSRDELVADVSGSLKVDESLVHGVIEELTAAKLLDETPGQPSRIRLTDAGRELYEKTSTEGAEIADRLYAGIPADELAVAGRVLTLVTERANAELAGA